MDRMDFREFAENIRTNISDYLMQYDVDSIELGKVNKNNGIALTALLIKLKASVVTPSIYLDGYYTQYLSGREMTEIYSDISDVFRNSMSFTNDYEKAAEVISDGDKNRFFLKVVGYEKNREQLQGYAYEQYLDMAVTLRYMVGDDENGIASAPVSIDMLQRMGIARSEAMEAAKENTRKMFPEKISDMKEIIAELTGEEDIYDEEIPDNLMLVISNDRGINGATNIIYPDVLEKAAEKLGGELYVFPSSIHELIAIPAVTGEPEEFQYMVSMINRNEVMPQEILTDSVYRYDAVEKKLTIAASENQNYADRYNHKDYGMEI